MTPNAFILACIRTSTGRKNHVAPDLDHGIKGLVTEAGELMDIVKRHEFYNEPLDEKHIIEELGDVLWYVSLILAHLGVPYEEVMERNIAKLKQRYAYAFSKDEALNRNLSAERSALEGE